MKSPVVSVGECNNRNTISLSPAGASYFHADSKASALSLSLSLSPSPYLARYFSLSSSLLSDGSTPAVGQERDRERERD